MLSLTVPGRKPYQFEHLALDLNGTLARDGQLLDGVGDRLAALSSHLAIHLLTADTGGSAAEICSGLDISLARVEPGAEATQKQAFVERLGAAHVVAIGNGTNDAGMLSTAALGVAVLGPEGLAVQTLQAADLVVACIQDALDLLLHPQRLVATLRR